MNNLTSYSKLDIVKGVCIDNYKKQVYYAEKIVGNTEDAKDIVQEAYIRVIRNQTSFSNAKHLKRRIDKTIKHLCINFLAKRRNRNKLLECLCTEKQEMIHIHAEILNMINNSFNTLSYTRQQIIQLWLEGYKNHEIAALIGLSENTVRVQKSEAIKAIRDYFLKNGGIV